MTLRLRPLDPENVPPGLTPQADHRGIAIHWQPHQPEPLGRKSKRRRASPWSVQRLTFSVVSASGESVPPRDAAELERYVRLAYAFAASHHPIPSKSDIVYEVRW